MLERLGTTALGRPLYLATVATFGDSSDDLEPVPAPFVAAILADAIDAPADAIAGLARKLLDYGAAYVCAWGDDCARVHDVVDEELLLRPPDPLVMTTWHEGEPLEEALEFAVLSALPAEGFGDAATRIAAPVAFVVVGAPVVADAVRAWAAKRA